MSLHKILCIDDDPDHLIICNIVLRNIGYEVRTLAGCENVDILFSAVKKFGAELIFMDHDMKGLCGADLIRALKKHADFSGIPVVFFSGRDDIVQLAREVKADDYLKKPFKIQDLKDKAQKYLPFATEK